MRTGTRLSLLALATMIGSAAAQPPSGPPHAPSASTIACRVLEVHTEATLGVTVVVFHHRDDVDRDRLGALLRAHDGATTRFQASDGAAHPATVMRLKSCFGRGLLLFPAGAARLAEKDEFLLSEPTAEAH